MAARFHLKLDPALVAWLRLAESPDIKPAEARALLARFGSAEDVLAASRAAIAQVVRASVVEALKADPDARFQQQLACVERWLADGRHHIVTLGDPAYPPRWLDLADPPALFYVDGAVSVLADPAFAVVGSRNASRAGEATARGFASTLAGRGLTIVSGLALGIDAAAHEGALDAGRPTIAILGTGCDKVYPPRNRELAQRIVAGGGAIVSASPLGTTAQAWVFPRRNRLIAAQTLGVLVVEAALQSGSLITAHLAADLGREVFAIPGSIHTPLSKGCHRLIKQGAQLVDDVDDVLLALKLEPVAEQLTLDLPFQRSGAFDWSGGHPFTLEDFAAHSKQPIETLLAQLSIHEIEGRLERLPGGRWQSL